MLSGPLSFSSSHLFFRHHAGMDNRVADALCRRSSLLTELRVEVIGFDTFWDLYPYDPFFGPIIALLTHGSHENCSVVEGFFCFG